ncbi:raffinose/stachyose/melibiose transport system substrate-binding protein [Pseudoclavibacter sp. JAI123]|uniref:ABC transporter substrate-binding protein n=1 Tax=Pseudoclavibacter sp. JAI123 TaxID=2723065 RepID=UPI0015CC37CA|nr:extracellular solute-binding protein [Pseudoclavibacter sp. JAI123]NYF14897.1 raffinose/stachyose/melibiose transport system substrate-binding protein [Pseudoclavibacter sp. JAI123]
MPPTLTPARTRVTTGLTAVAVVVALAGCSNSSASTPSAGSLDFSFSYPSTENSPYAALAERYMEANPGVTVTLNPIPSENYDSVLRTQLQGGNASDVIMATPGSGTTLSVISLAQANLLAPLAETNAALVDEGSKPLFFVDGEQFGHPTDISITGTVFNEAPGVAYPESSEELLETCAALDGGTSLFALAGSVPINGGIAAVTIAATNVYAENPDWDAQRAAGEVSFAGTEGWRATLQLIIDMKDAGCFQAGAEGSGFDAIVNGIGQGTSLGAFIPGGAAVELGRSSPEAELVVESFPAPKGAKPFIFASSDYAVSISEASERKEAAQAFLDWFAEPENAEGYADAAGTIPITGIDGIDLTNSTHAPVAQLIADGQYTQFPVNIWSNPSVFDKLGSGVQALLTGQQSVDGLLGELDAAWDSK